MPDLSRRPVRPTADESEDLEYQKWVGERIRTLRQALKMNQDDFSYMVGVQRSYIGLIENGKRDIRINTLRRIAVACEIELYELLNEGFDLSAIRFTSSSTQE